MFRLIIFLSIFSILCNCSTEISGGSTDTELGGPVVSGIVVDVDGDPVEGASITLVPFDYNPGIDAPLSSNLKTLSDIKGLFEIVSDSVSAYSIELYSPDRRNKALRQNINLYSDTILDTLVLKNTGSITIMLPEGVDTSKGYLFLPGTTIFKSLSGGNVQAVGAELFILFDSLPATVISEINYGDNFETKILMNNVSLLSDDTLKTISTIENWQDITNGLPSDTILCSAIDLNDQKWIGTAENGLYKSEGSGWKNYDTSMSLGLNNLSNRVTSLLAEKDGTIWIGTDSGLASIKDTLWYTYSIKAGAIPRDRVMDLAFDDSGDLLVLFPNVLYKHTDTIWYHDSVNVNGIVTDLNTIAIDSNGTIYVGANTGLYSLSEWGNTSWEKLPMNHVQDDESKNINQITVDKDNGVWCATNNSIHHYYDSEWIEYNNVNSVMPLGIVNTICKDNSNLIWSGFQAVDTISRFGLMPKMFTGTNTSILNGIGAVSNIIVSDNNDIYISTVKGVLIRGSYGLIN